MKNSASSAAPDVSYPRVYDCVIVGAGPAGLSAAVLLARYRRHVLTLDSRSPRNLYSHGVHGFLGHDGILPADLLARGRQEVARYGGSIVDGLVTRAERTHDRFTLSTASSRLETATVLLATGLRDLTPSCPGFAAYYGISVHHCSDCDGFEWRDTRIAVLGLEGKCAPFARKLLTWTTDITLIIENSSGPDHVDRFPVVRKNVTRLEGDTATGRLECVRFQDGTALDCEALFFSLGTEPSCDLHLQLGCEVDDLGLVVVDRRQQTSVESVFAAGDLTPHSQLAIVAAAEGAMAAIQIHNQLADR